VPRVIERELKFISTETTPPKLPEGWSLGEPSHHVLHDTYLDIDGLIAAAGLTLRQREEPGVATRYTLKAALESGTGAEVNFALAERREIEAAAEPNGEFPAAIMVALDASSAVPRRVRRADVRSTLRIEQLRAVWPLLHRATPVAILSVDDVRLPNLAGPHAAWIEVEIEFFVTTATQEEREQWIGAAAEELTATIVRQPGFTVSGLSKEQRARRAAGEVTE
jgi:hypothetical protein